ncbi:MAG: GNAT family N-acetyltransferase [Candidatus Dormiibacterota bacterium]
MPVVTTPRLIFAPTPLAVLRERLVHHDFMATVPLEDGAPEQSLSVHFSDEWPGEDALSLLPIWVTQREQAANPGPWLDGVLIDRVDRLAVGSMGFKGAPDARGSVEIGYSVNRSRRGRGYATEMVKALTAWALRQPGVRRVIAECLESNVASIRVLQKSGFARVGHRISDDGNLLLWEWSAADVEAT